MSWEEARSLDESLMSLDDFFTESPCLVEVLSGGLTNRCWKLAMQDGRAYVWRPVSSVSQAYGISRVQEYRLLDALKTSQFTPQPVFLNAHGLLVEWVDGGVLHSPLHEFQLIGMLVRIHSVEVRDKPIPHFSYTSKVDGYWYQLKPEFKDNEYTALYTRWRELPVVEPVQPTLCHHDFGHYNLIETDKGLKVIDWEYAGVGDPRMDLAMMIDIEQLNMPSAVVNYCKIRGIENADIWIQGVNAWKPHHQMMSMLWYLLGYQIWRDESYLYHAQQLKIALNSLR
ncbi:phosphotransferase [Vibrio albus]|nr:phosphotransferase [Vibrio albus]